MQNYAKIYDIENYSLKNKSIIQWRLPILQFSGSYCILNENKWMIFKSSLTSHREKITFEVMKQTDHILEIPG